MRWHDELKADPLPWLLEADEENPGVRYFALRDLLDKSEEEGEVRAAQAAVMQSGHVPRFLEGQEEDGFWVEPGAGYSPKYRSTSWSLIFLAQLGADGQHTALRKAGEYVLEHSRSPRGSFSTSGNNSGNIHCLQGNLAAALIDFGWLGDKRLDEAIEWLARSITGRDIGANDDKEAEVRYLRTGNTAPGFACSSNWNLPCAWGAIKALLALSRIPSGQRSIDVVAAIEMGKDFLLARDPSLADYPAGEGNKPSNNWFKFGFPVGYVTDVLQNLEVLTELGLGSDERLHNALNLLLSKQDERGRWKLEYSYTGKTWSDIEEHGKPSKWVTLRAARVLKRVAEQAI